MISPCHLLFVGIARSPTCAARGVVLPTRGFTAEASSRSALGRDASREYTDLAQTAAPIRDGPLALGPWKHALTGSREISAIFKRSSMTQVTGRRLRVTKQPIDTNRLAGQTGVFAEFRGQRSLQHRLPGRADALCSLKSLYLYLRGPGRSGEPPVGLFLRVGLSMSDRSRRRGALSIPLVAHAHGAKFPSSHKFTVGDHLLEGRQAPSVCLGRVPPGQRFFVRRMSPKVAQN